MEKRKLSAIAREKASEDMIEIAGRLKGMRHIVTAQMVEDNRILILTFYKISDIAKGEGGSSFQNISLSRRLYNSGFESGKSQVAYGILFHDERI